MKKIIFMVLVVMWSCIHMEAKTAGWTRPTHKEVVTKSHPKMRKMSQNRDKFLKIRKKLVARKRS